MRVKIYHIYAFSHHSGKRIQCTLLKMGTMHFTGKLIQCALLKRGTMLFAGKLIQCSLLGNWYDALYWEIDTMPFTGKLIQCTLLGNWYNALYWEIDTMLFTGKLIQLMHFAGKMGTNLPPYSEMGLWQFKNNYSKLLSIETLPHISN